MYQAPSFSTLMGLNSQLQQIKKKGISMSDYLTKMKKIFDAYAAMGEPVSYCDKLIHLLNGLGEEYDGVVTSIQNHLDQPSLIEIHNILYSFEC